MSTAFYMPTKILEGDHCLLNHSDLLSKLGTKALIVTGRNSARTSGALAEVTAALEKEGRSWELFDRVTSNPSISCVREGALMAREVKADFIIGIGGGSPLDASKAIALLAVNELDDTKLFTPPFAVPPLPIAAVPTTAGTGSEVTQYAILTTPAEETKRSISHESLFPRLAFLDSRFSASLSREVTINTAIDALSHSLEGYLTKRATAYSKALSREALAIAGKALRALAAGTETFPGERELLLRASTLGGMVIAQSGTTIVHGMGYSLTFFRTIDHGRANGLLLGAALERIGQDHPAEVAEVLEAAGYTDLASFTALLDSLLGEREALGDDEIERFTAIALTNRNIQNTISLFSASDIRTVFRKSLSR